MSDFDEIAPEAQHFRHTEPLGDPLISPGDRALIEEVTRHLETQLGPVSVVYHEIVSEYAHIDVYHFPPTSDREFHVLATSGMSERAMATPEDLPADLRYAELLINLPADWPFSEESLKDEQFYWPVRCLKTLARFPHVYATWLGYAHTIPNGDPPVAYAANTQLCGSMLVPPVSLPDAVHRLERAAGPGVHFWNLLPLYAEEMDYKVRNGADALFEKLDAAGISDVVDPQRPNVISRRAGGPF